LVAILATDSLSETAEKVRIFAAAKVADGLCPLTGEQTFVEAVARVLDRSQPYWRKIETITVRRTSGQGVIAIEDNLRHADSIFAVQLPIDAKLRASTELVVNAMLIRDLVIDVAIDLKTIADTEERSRSDAL
jgi:alanine dehydrogenase